MARLLKPLEMVIDIASSFSSFGMLVLQETSGSYQTPAPAFPAGLCASCKSPCAKTIRIPYNERVFPLSGICALQAFLETGVFGRFLDFGTFFATDSYFTI